MEILLITIITILATGIGTVTGFGTSTILVPVLLFFLPLPETLLLVGIIHWFGDIWKIILFRKGFNWRLILTFGLAGIISTWFGASIIFKVSVVLLTQVLGGFLIIYVLFLYLKPSFKLPQKTSSAIAGGLLSGFFAGLLGVGGAIRGAFLTAFNLPKAVYISTAGAIALVIDSTRITTYYLNNVVLDNKFVWGLLAFIPASFIGAKIAKMFVNKIPQQKFRKVIAVFLLLAGLKFIFFS